VTNVPLTMTGVAETVGWRRQAATRGSSPIYYMKE
jgi:hypothetical protein